MPFPFTDKMRDLMADIAAMCAELRHVDMARVAAAFSQARHGRLDGVYACIHPLRFPSGERVSHLHFAHGRLVPNEDVTPGTGRGTYEMPRVVIGGVEMLYVVEFRMPRFLCLPFDEKIATTVHEMYHVSPRFDGTLRRFEGGKPYHSGSRRRYDAAMGEIAKGYLARTDRPELHAFLRMDFKQLSTAHGGVVGLRFRRLRPRRIG